MDLKSRISSFLNQILMSYGLTQKDLAEVLNISPGSLSAYLKKGELPRVDIILKLAEIGGLTVDDLLKTEKTPEKKDISVQITAGDKSSIASTVFGNIHHQPAKEIHIHKYSPQPGDLNEGQAFQLKNLVDEIVALEKIVKQKPRSYAGVYNALKKRFKVTYYQRIRQDEFELARAYLERWRGRLKSSKSFSKKAPEDYRKRKYRDIFSISKLELGWSKDDVDHFIFDHYSVPSIKNLTESQLENLYQRITGLKRKL
jgi:transcriptional regulator with XRE-family HTH domain